MKRIIYLIFALSLFCFATSAAADSPSTEGDVAGIKPWFTGPLLAPAGHVIPKGHQNFELYFFATDNIGTYNNRGHHVHRTNSRTLNPTLVWSVGLVNRVDFQLIVPYHFNRRSGQHGMNVGDTTVFLGFQLLNDKPHTFIPDLRFAIHETVPTGRYQSLRARKLGTDATGAGSFQTGFSLNFQKLEELYKNHFLRTRLSLMYTIPASTSVKGLNVYGGGMGTSARVRPGDKFSADLAFEYTLTQHIVPAFDILYGYTKKSKMTAGTPGITGTGMPAMVGRPSGSQLSIAPAIEYNFTSTLGVIAGAWFSLKGRNSSDFAGGVIALNYFV